MGRPCSAIGASGVEDPHDQRTVETTLELHGLVAARPLGSLRLVFESLTSAEEETSAGVGADESRHLAVASVSVTFAGRY